MTGGLGCSPRSSPLAARRSSACATCNVSTRTLGGLRAPQSANPREQTMPSAAAVLPRRARLPAPPSLPLGAPPSPPARPLPRALPPLPPSLPASCSLPVAGWGCGSGSGSGLVCVETCSKQYQAIMFNKEVYRAPYSSATHLVRSTRFRQGFSTRDLRYPAGRFSLPMSALASLAAVHVQSLTPCFSRPPLSCSF